MGDEELVEADESLIRKARRKVDDSKLIEHAVRWAVIAAVGAGSSMATRQVSDADQSAVVQTNRAEVEKLKAEIEMLRDGFTQRVDVEEREREAEQKRFERRITWLEARLNISAPAAAEAPEN